MAVFEEMVGRNHEQVSYFYDEHTGLKCIISVHNTILGPGLGGCRVWNYNNEHEALIDVLRLSRGMTYKAAIAGLNLGGAKAVILADDNTVKNEAYFRSFGRFVEAMGGRYITAEDVGTSVSIWNGLDLKLIMLLVYQDRLEEVVIHQLSLHMEYILVLRLVRKKSLIKLILMD